MADETLYVMKPNTMSCPIHLSNIVPASNDQIVAVAERLGMMRFDPVDLVEYLADHGLGLYPLDVLLALAHGFRQAVEGDKT